MIVGLLTLQEPTLLVSAAFCLAISKFAAVTVLTLDTITFAAVDTLGSLLAVLLRPCDQKLNGVLYKLAMDGLWHGSRMLPIQRLHHRW